MIHLNSTDTTNLLKDLINAKKSFKKPRFDKKGARNDYASLESIIDAVTYPLLENNLVIEFKEACDDQGNPFLYTILRHISGQWTCSRSLIRLEKDGQIKSINQQYGAALSYAKRYSIASLLGISASNDDIDDYNYDSSTDHSDRDQIVELVGDAEVANLQKFSKAYQEKILAYNKVSDLSELTMKQYQAIMKVNNK